MLNGPTPNGSTTQQTCKFDHTQNANQYNAIFQRPPSLVWTSTPVSPNHPAHAIYTLNPSAESRPLGAPRTRWCDVLAKYLKLKQLGTKLLDAYNIAPVTRVSEMKLKSVLLCSQKLNHKATCFLTSFLSTIPTFPSIYCRNANTFPITQPSCRV